MYVHVPIYSLFEFILLPENSSKKVKYATNLHVATGDVAVLSRLHQVGGPPFLIRFRGDAELCAFFETQYVFPLLFIVKLSPVYLHGGKELAFGFLQTVIFSATACIYNYLSASCVI